MLRADGSFAVAGALVHVPQLHVLTLGSTRWVMPAPVPSGFALQHNNVADTANRRRARVSTAPERSSRCEHRVAYWRREEQGKDECPKKNSHTPVSTQARSRGKGLSAGKPGTYTSCKRGYGLRWAAACLNKLSSVLNFLCKKSLLHKSYSESLHKFFDFFLAFLP
jgi:hypothetical protein